MLREISLFVQENSGTITFLFVAVLLLLIALIRQWYKDHKKLSTELNKAQAERSNLWNTHHAYEHLVRAVISALNGATRSWSATPDSIFSQFLHFGEVDRDEWEKYLAPYITNIEGATMLKRLRLPAALNSLVAILEVAKKVGMDGYRYYENNGDKTRDISQLVEEYRLHVTNLMSELSEVLPDADTKGFEANLMSLIEPLKRQGHVNEAKYLFEHLRLGMDGMDIAKARQFLSHCQAADVDPKDLIPANLHKCWDMVATAISTLNAAVIKQEPVAEAASSE